ncbi:TetR family transcriptional regulator [Kitasatospora albolonga]|uniref:TetR family transcriptional regulator n=1 Tax=Kitasatospora albolonga TaxID=68173 RepID=UPI003CD0831A
MSQHRSTADTSRERIIAAATTLFAEHGYDGTATRTIAAAAGLNIATVGLPRRQQGGPVPRSDAAGARGGAVGRRGRAGGVRAGRGG